MGGWVEEKKRCHPYELILFIHSSLSCLSLNRPKKANKNIKPISNEKKSSNFKK